MFSCAFAAYGQDAAVDTSIRQSAIREAVAAYQKVIGPQARLFNGSEYIHFPFKFDEGSPYFLSDSLQTGYVIYDGVRFDRVPLLYDQVRDQLITMEDGNFFKIYLVNEKVTAFSILEHTFIRIVPDSLHKSVLSAGFYDRYYQGKTGVYVKTVKLLQENTNSDGLKHNINTATRYYVLKDGKYHPVKKEKSVLALLGDKKKEVRQYLRKNKIRYRKDRATAIARTMAYYDQLTM